MQCPNDQTTLAMTDRQGIEIDYCPTCRGVWLDKGELDKLIANSESAAPAAQQPAPSQTPQQRYEEPRYNDRDHDRRDNNHGYRGDDRGGYHKKHKKESFLGDLFDF